MSKKAEFRYIPVADIKVSERQRQELGDIDDLAKSIQLRGLYHPVVVTREMQLVAGERRLRAVQKLGLEKIPVHFIEELDPDTLRLIELEENIKRKNLEWAEEAKAVYEIHQIYVKQDESWTYEKTADAIGFSKKYVHEQAMVGERLIKGDEKIVAAESVRSARNVIYREQSRAIDTELAQLEAATEAPTADLVPAHQSVLTTDFISWAADYRGRKFNFLHCDFPYGINYGTTEQSGGRTKRTFDDSPEVYWELLAALCKHRNKFLLSSAHIIFWFSMEYYTKTIEFINKNAPDIAVNLFPLVWHKSDLRGILPDPERGPRRTYETALFMSRGDRRIVKAVSNSHVAPTAKLSAPHINYKPEPVLRHFFQLCVDNLSEVLDPTCGSGAALIAAEDLGATRSLGLELDEEFASDARNRISTARRLRLASQRIA